MLFGVRFDFRNPELAHTAMADRYEAALDMVEWADRLGAVMVAVSEHHGSPDGYLPSPVPMLGAMAARSQTVRFLVAALIAPFYDPIRLAEDMVVLDNLSRGRIDLIVAGGYVAEEFEQYGVSMGERPARVTEAVETLRAAFTGRPFEYRGRTVHITPAPFSPNGPSVLLGGSSEAAARRAARIADGFVPSTAEAWEYYRDEVQVLGRADPGPSPVGPTNVVALAEDPEQGWREMAPFFLHESNAYGIWNERAGLDSPYRTFADVDELATTGQYRVLTPKAYVDELRGPQAAFVNLHPLCGGMPIDLAWSSLRLFEERVLPTLP